MATHWETFKDVDYVKTFSSMKSRYDQYEYGRLEKAKRETSDEKRPSSPPAIVSNQWKKERESDNDEVFFEKDDDEDENWYSSRKENEEMEATRRSPVGKTDGYEESNKPVRKTGLEPLFQKRRVVTEDDDTPVVFGGTSISAKRQAPRAVVFNFGANKTPPQSPPSADDHSEVTSTVSGNTTPTSTKGPTDVDLFGKLSSTPIMLKPGCSSLVSSLYDESDSDEEDESDPNQHLQCDTEPTSSSSTEALGPSKAGHSSTIAPKEEENDDVSSTSGEAELSSDEKEGDVKPESTKLYNGEHGKKRARVPSVEGSEYDMFEKIKPDEAGDHTVESELYDLNSPVKKRRMEKELKNERPPSPTPTF